MKKLLATLLILCAGPVWAEWVEYRKSENGSRFYFDPSTVKGGGGIKRVWHKIVLKTPSKNGALSFRAYMEFDCVNEKTRILHLEAFSKADLGGETLLRDTEPSEWEYVAPETIHKTLLNKVCGKK